MNWKHITVLLLFGSAMAMIFYSGANPTFDDALYLKFSSQVIAGNFNILSSPYAYGIGFIYPLALAQEALGSIGPSILQVLEYLSIGIVVYLTLCKYFSNKIALGTSLSLEASIFILGYASRVLPDMMLGLLIAIVFLILAYRRDTALGMLLAGFMSGLTLIVKMGGFVALLLAGISAMPLVVVSGIVLVCIYYYFKELSKPRRTAYIAGLFLAILLIQSLMPVSLLGMTNLYLNNQARISQANLNLNVQTMIVNLIAYEYAQDQIFPIGALLIFAIIGTGIILWKKDKRFYFAVLAFWVSFLYLYLGTESFMQYTFITVESRYFIELCAPMAILAGAFLSWLSRYFSENKILIYSVLITMMSNVPMYFIFFTHPLPVFVFK